jgi:hypothetical protein
LERDVSCSITDFLVCSDLHVGHSTGGGASRTRDLCIRMAKERAQFAMFNGDILDLGTVGSTAADMAYVSRCFDMLPFPRFAGVGNHDNGTGDSYTDCTPESLNDYFDMVGGHEGNPLEDLDDARDVGYYHFNIMGVDFIVLNTVELQPNDATEGDYGISSTQKTWLAAKLATLTGSSRRLFVFSHIDPSQTSVGWARLNTTDSAYIRGELQDWRAEQGGKVCAVISGHEHGINNSSANRVTRTSNIDYVNLIDGLNAAGNAAHIKASAYSTLGRLAYSRVSYDHAANKVRIEGFLSGNHTLTPV